MNDETNAQPSGNGLPVSLVDTAIGIDLENVDNMPGSGDARVESFYRDNFTAREIEYCARQPHPKLAFCRLWCAKEALLKCGRHFTKLQPIEIEIHHDETGTPRLAGTSNANISLSISHSGTMCIAICIVAS